VHGARVGAVGEAIDPEAGARDVRGDRPGVSVFASREC
jgi:hypothetical protein